MPKHLIRTIAIHLATPSAQKDDWYGWVTNQCGHAWLVGVPMGLLVVASDLSPIWAFPVLIVGYYLIWETLIQRNPDTLDSVTDCFHVVLGGVTVWLAANSLIAWSCLLFLVQMPLFLAGISNRIRDDN